MRKFIWSFIAAIAMFGAVACNSHKTAESEGVDTVLVDSVVNDTLVVDTVAVDSVVNDSLV